MSYDNSRCQSSSKYTADTALRASCINSFPTATPEVGTIITSLDEETKGQRKEVTCPGLQS